MICAHFSVIHPFGEMFDKYIFCSCQELLTSIAVRMTKRNILYILFSTSLNFILLQVPCRPVIRNAEFINSLIEKLLYMKPVICHSSIRKSRTNNLHHSGRQVQSHLLHRFTFTYMNHFKHLYNILQLSPTYHNHKRTFITCPLRLATTVHNSPQLKEISSIQRLEPIFCLNRTYSEHALTGITLFKNF